MERMASEHDRAWVDGLRLFPAPFPSGAKVLKSGTIGGRRAMVFGFRDGDLLILSGNGAPAAALQARVSSSGEVRIVTDDSDAVVRMDGE